MKMKFSVQSIYALMSYIKMKIKGRIVRETNKAICIQFNKELSHWIPKVSITELQNNIFEIDDWVINKINNSKYKRKQIKRKDDKIA